MRSVLVTGASSGIGLSCARRLSAEGYFVLAGAHDEEGEESLRSSCPDAEAFVLDVTDRADLQRAAELVADRTGGKLSGLVNNAGLVVPGALEALDIEEFREQLEVNLIGQLAVTQALLPALRAALGRIVFIGSIAGKGTVPQMGAYSASKYGLEGMADAMRQELRGAGVEVSLIEPGPVATPIWGKASARARRFAAGLPAGPLRNDYGDIEELAEHFDRAPGLAQEPDSVASAVLEALTSERPRSRYPVGLSTRFVYRVRPFIPDRLYDAIVSRL